MSKFMSVMQKIAWGVGAVYQVLSKLETVHNQDSTTPYITSDI